MMSIFAEFVDTFSECMQGHAINEQLSELAHGQILVAFFIVDVKTLNFGFNFASEFFFVRFH
jgi:hypothetical protein